MKNEDSQVKKKAWGYPESFMIAFELLILGFALEVISGGRGLSSPHMPYNIYILFTYTILTIILHIYYRDTAW